MAFEKQAEYIPVKRKYYYEELGLLTTYGIRARFRDKEIIINDISTNEETVNNLISFFEENDVEFCHFEAVIEDIIFSGQ